MHPFGFLHAINAGSFESELLSLAITMGTGEVFHGQGFLSWTRNRGPRIKAITDGGQTLNDHFRAIGGRLRDVGQLMPEAKFATLEAVARDGAQIQIARLDPNHYDVRTDHPAVLWRFTRRSILSSLRLTSLKPSTDRYAEFLVSGTVTFDWPRRTPANQACFDFRCGLGRLIGIKTRRGLWRITLEPTDACDIERAATAIIVALSFWTGSVAQIVAYESTEADAVRRVLRSSRQTPSDTIAPPLGYTTWLELVECHESLLAKAIDFFYLPEHDQIASSLFAFQGSEAASFTSHALISCAVLEGLAQRLAGVSVLETISPQQHEQVEEFLKQSGFPSELVNRIRGFVGTLNTPSGANAISAWAKTGFLGINEEDRQAWKALRNAAAHGKFSLFEGPFDKRRQRVHERNCVYNLINKLILHAIGYQGKYFDYKLSRIEELQPPATAGSIEKHSDHALDPADNSRDR